ncbi:MAG TPA: hypothetical protein VL285_16415 [Bryobacteraceae bacterium]|nr:hypothetical protein [Bryobacteraceae bacterium]
MRKPTLMTRFALCTAGLFLLSSAAAAGEKKMMHCFAFTVIDTATDADWQAFYKATDQLPSKIPGISRVWYGKLRAPLNIFNTTPEVSKQLRGGAGKASGEVTLRVRKSGVCMEMENEGTLKTYTTHPFHKEWEAIYAKVRVAGTTTFDILGQ